MLILRLMVIVSLLACARQGAYAQLAGSRAGVDGPMSGVAELPLLARETVESHIAIEGRAVIRVPPTEIRIVMAVTGEGDSAQQCRQIANEKIERLKGAWSKLSIPAENMLDDFIAVLPRYEWQVEEQSGVDVGIEKKVGYRMQTNLHLAVPDESKAGEALAAAFEQNVTDIIAFDYWNDELEEAKAQARKEAVEAARGKADMLLGAVFQDRPQAINVQEETVVRYPDSLYHSFTNVDAEAVTPSFRRDIPLIRAHRPRNTYYRGLDADADVQPSELPMQPEISVVSTVRIYYKSPARAETSEERE